MPDLTYTPWSFHSTLAISWLLMPQKLDNAEAQIIFMIILVCFCPNPHNKYNKVAAGGKFSLFITDSWLNNFNELSLYSPQRTKRSRNIKSHKDKLCQPRSVHGVSFKWIVREYSAIVTVNNLGRGRSLSAKQNLFNIDSCFHQPAY